MPVSGIDQGEIRCRPSDPPAMRRFRGEVVGPEATHARLKALGVTWQEAAGPGFPLHQTFLHDPTGIMVEPTLAT